jgi:hypothetical protein
VPTERDRSAPPTDRRVRGIDHVGITVRKLEQSLAFHRDLLGAEVIKLSRDGGVWQDCNWHPRCDLPALP